MQESEGDSSSARPVNAHIAQFLVLLPGRVWARVNLQSLN